MASGVGLEINAAITRFRFNEGNLQALLRGPQGAVARDLTRRVIRVEAQAKINATRRPGPRVRTGRLRGSITHRIGSDGQGLYGDVGSSVFYAPFVEYGTSRMPAYPFLRPALSAARG